MLVRRAELNHRHQDQHWPQPAIARRHSDRHHDRDSRRLGSGWVSGTLAMFLGALGVGAVLCLHFPSLLTSPELRAIYPMPLVRAAIQAVLLLAFLLAALSIGLRRRKLLGGTGLALALLATLLGGAGVTVAEPVPKSAYLGLDWFLLNLLLTALVFVPLERAFALRPRQRVLRDEWRTDLAWFFGSHALVQVLSLLIFLPAAVIVPRVEVPALRAWVTAWPAPLQFLAVLLVADLTQYWVHRAFHEIPWLWRFHRVHHSAHTLDWLAGSRLHLVDIAVTRGLVLVPVLALGFAPGVIWAYLVFVSFHAVFIHANFAPRARWLEALLVLPRFHHWHHAAGCAAAVNKNYAVHLPWLDRAFGTAHCPGDAWPERYGLDGEAAPSGWLAQLGWPFRRRTSA